MSYYSATKAFNNHLSRAIEEELGDKIDIVLATPGPTKTSIFNVLDQTRQKPGKFGDKIFETFVTSEPRDVVRETLNRLGTGETHISGTWKHEIFETLQRNMPGIVSIKNVIGLQTYMSYAEPRSSNINKKTENEVKDYS
jgi:short-subunit dehydrogenase